MNKRPPMLTRDIRVNDDRRAERWAGAMLAEVPEPWRGRVGKIYRKKLAHYAGSMGYAPRNPADYWLESLAEKTGGFRLPVGMSDSEIVQAAEKCAASAWSLAESVPGRLLDVVALRDRLEKFVGGYGIKPPCRKVDHGPAIARMTDSAWWRRALRVSQARAMEGVGIDLGYVHRRGEIYATDATVKRRGEQRRRNAAALENTLAINLDTDQEYTLAKLAELSVANPAIRRGELMVRIRGFEAVAKRLGHVAEFVTLTCPSRFHAMKQLDGGKVVKNRLWDGSGPREAQKYLTGLWARLRAKFARMGLGLYGFRIAEPHHDATPHWHMLIFMPSRMRKVFRVVFGGYALGVVRPHFKYSKKFGRYVAPGTGVCWLDAAGGEVGAGKHRVTFEAIDWSRGTAAGYVAKYVSKNIDGGGYQVQGDVEGDMQALSPSHRVEAWASTWGIRQFQQIGGPPVGVWRELRRMDTCTVKTVEAARIAAGVKSEGFLPDWSAFVDVMGGPVKARKDRPLRVAYEVLPGRNRYGEDRSPTPCGVEFVEWQTVTDGLCTYPQRVFGVVESRRYRWEIRPRVGVGFSGAAKQPSRTCVNNCTRPDWARVASRGFKVPAETLAERETRESWEKWRGSGGLVATD